MGDFLADDNRSFTLCTDLNINSACGHEVKTFHPAITAPVLLVLLGCETPSIILLFSGVISFFNSLPHCAGFPVYANYS